MRANSYNKSEIMKQAWTMFRSKFYGYRTFAEALKMAWHYAKEEVARIKQVEARKAEELVAIETRKALQTETKKDKFYKEFGQREYEIERYLDFFLAMRYVNHKVANSGMPPLQEGN